MQLEIQLFAGVRDAVQQERVSVEVPEGARVADVRDVLVRRFPNSEQLIAASRVAVDQAYVADSDLILPGREIALIPPVSGG